METRFCSVCGAENPESAGSCEKCGLDFIKENDDTPRASLPLFWPAVGLYIVTTGVLLAVSSLLDALEGFSFRISQPSGSSAVSLYQYFPGADVAETLVAPGLSRVFWPILYFTLGSFATALLFRRRLSREIALGGAALLLLQLFFWLFAIQKTAGGVSDALGSLFGGTLYIIKGSNISTLPSGFLAIALLLLFWLSGSAGGMLGNFVAELSTGKTACPHCNQRFPVREKTSVCPHCRTALSRSRIQWPQVAGGVALTVLLFSLALSFLGPTLGFYYHCQPGELSDTCEEALAVYRKSRVEDGASSSWMLLGRLATENASERTYLILVHTWKYVGFLSLVFFFAPFLLGWRVKRGALPTAGITVPLSWLAVTTIALLFFDFGGFEGSFLISLRLHVIAFFAWGLVGSLGAITGHKRGSSSVAAMMEEIEG